MIGRSNVGKSSLINMLVNQKGLAKTSAKPGKTQVINHFLINENWYLVDLPGYGWASVGKQKKAEFSKMNEQYLLNRPNLQCLFVLIDSRLEPQMIDLDFIHWVGKHEIPLVLVFTKADKQNLTQTTRSVDLFKETLSKEWEELPQYFISSAQSGLGKEEILHFIHDVNQNFNSLP